MRKKESHSPFSSPPTQKKDNKTLAQLIRKTRLKADSIEGEFLTPSLDTDRPSPAPSFFDSETEPFFRPLHVPSCKRYELLQKIGEGAMGYVFKAHDCALNRTVALKFLRDENQATLKRFLKEAQAQAKLDHPGVCRVYEFGLLEGKAFISMQYIDGVTLNAASSKMSLSEKIDAIKQVTETVHAAHRAGLVHRDLKPGNILIQESSDRTREIFVADFGLVHEQDSKEITKSGFLVGTPAYMSPEQLEGKNSSCDARTDIYSLGVTLYELISGERPFEGENDLEITLKILQDPPLPLREIVPHISIDLETIVMKCLQKEPADRYDSARALGEDLSRYLDGEPIVARPSTWGQRLVKKMKKNKALVGAIGAAVLAIMISTGLAIHAHFSSAKKLELAQKLGQDFGQEIEGMKNILRYAYTLPPHDTRQEKTEIRKRIAVVKERLNRAGKIGEGPGYYALGYGYLTVRDYENARLCLDRAWNSGFRTPDISFALGLVYGRLYQGELEDSQHIGNKKLLQERKKQLDRKLLVPALSFLNQIHGKKVDSPKDYVEGSIAFYQGQFDTALEKAQDTLLDAPWFYEASMLKGDIYQELGNQSEVKGNLPEAVQYYGKGIEAFRSSAETARSDPLPYLGECECWKGIMETKIRKMDSVFESFQKAIAACELALLVDAEAPKGFTLESNIYFRLAENQRSIGEDSQRSLKKSIEMAEKAERLQRPRFFDLHSKGLAYQYQAAYQAEHSADPTASYDRSIQSLTKAIELNPNNAFGYNALGMSHAEFGRYRLIHGLDPIQSLENAINIYKHGLQIDADSFLLWNNLGAAYCYKGIYQNSTGADPTDSLDKSITSLGKSIQRNPDYINAYTNLANANFEQGLFLSRQDIDPTPALDQARAALKTAVNKNPKFFGSYFVGGKIDLAAARWAVQKGRNPAPFLKTAEDNFRRAIKLNTRYAPCFERLSELYRLKAEWTLKRKGNPNVWILQGLKMAEQALELNSNLTEAVGQKGILFYLKFQTEHSLPKKNEAARNAHIYLEEAILQHPALQNEYRTLSKQLPQHLAIQ